jgi:ATP-dependent RNA circularization protein (DNA/RNA ligase family)
MTREQYLSWTKNRGEDGSVSDFFFKFPSTPYLVVLGDSVIRDDKVLSEDERAEFLQHELIVEEKVDGANLGVSFDSSGYLKVQNRGAYLEPPYLGQWKKLAEWLKPRVDSLFDLLKNQYLLFGEWCYAQHSVTYNRLPDWFLGFDIFDRKNKKFLSCRRRDKMLHDLGVANMPLLKQGRFSVDEITGLLSNSHLGNRPAEGLYLRYDAADWLGGRAKLVRPGFIQVAGEHWTRRPMEPNQMQSR